MLQVNISILVTFNSDKLLGVLLTTGQPATRVPLEV